MANLKLHIWNLSLLGLHFKTKHLSINASDVHSCQSDSAV